MVTVSPLNNVLGRMVSLSRAMDDVMSRADENGAGQYWVPAMDAWETEQAFVVQLDLPGVTPEQVDLTFDRNTLSVRGTRSATIQAPETGEIRVFFAERAPGSFTRTLKFPLWVESSRIEASFSNGVLTITVPKAEAAKPRKIAVSAAGIAGN
jgi:HSP20 family protein